MAFDDKIEGISGIDSKGKSSDIEKAGGASFQPPPPPPPPPAESNPLNNIQDTLSIKSFDDQKQ
jgi:hypothetical protein